MTPEHYPPTTILRANPGMIRDAYIEDQEVYGEKQKVLIIRQIRFSDQSNPQDSSSTKVFRLVGSEILAIKKLLMEEYGNAE